MKKVLLTVFVAAALVSNAATIIVDNNATKPTNVIDNLQTALDSAQAGDIIQIIPSVTSYGNGTVITPVTIVGVGHFVDTQDGLISQVGHLNIEATAGGTVVDGLKTGNLNLYASLDGLTVRNSYAGSLAMQTGVTNVLVYNCILIGQIGEAGYSPTSISNITISNNIINTSYVFAFDNLSSNILIANNVIKGPAGGQFGYDLNNSVITNNIITGGILLGGASTNNNSFSNNISNSAEAFPTGTNSSSNNLTNTDPLFVALGAASFAYSDDYRLQAGSPAIGFGSDGNDAGIYGGMYPWPTIINAAPGYQNGTVPDLPRVTGMNVRNASVPETGQLEVEVVGEVHQ